AKLVEIENNGIVSFNLELLDKPQLINFKDDVFANLSYELELCGVYFSQHPTELIRVKDKYPYLYLSDIENQEVIYTLAIISKVKTYRTKSGEMMAFVELSDVSGNFDVAIMPDLYKKEYDLIKTGILLKIELRKSSKGRYLIKRVVKCKESDYE
ncbi:MAG: hypothetical protein ACK5G7_02460, partial [Erysipelotrichaceae bacterium]